LIDIDKIEAAAKAATPGPWDAAGPSFGAELPKYLDCVGVTDEDGTFEDVCICPHLNDDTATENMTHIATANPAAVLEMVSMIRERDAVLRQALEALASCEVGLAVGYGLSRVAAIEAMKEIRKVLEP